MAENTIQSVSIDTIPAIVYQDRPVITTGHLAKLYQTDERVLRKNFHRQSERFNENSEFFLLKGEKLKAFKQNLQSVAGGGSRLKDATPTVAADAFESLRSVSQLTLWTERGCLFHAKILDNDKAWDVFARLVDVYFHTCASLSLSEKRTDIHPDELKSLKITYTVWNQCKLRIAAIAKSLPTVKDALEFKVLWAELVERCTLIGMPVPDINDLDNDLKSSVSHSIIVPSQSKGGLS